MNIDAAGKSARRSAANAQDIPSRVALADKFRSAAAMCVGALGGLHLAEPDGHVVDHGVAAHLRLAEQILTGIAEELDDDSLWLTVEENDEINEARAAANPAYMIRADQLDKMLASARLAERQTLRAHQTRRSQS
jgi:hypothetical protein